jgi:hypothetical protein
MTVDREYQAHLDRAQRRLEWMKTSMRVTDVIDEPTEVPTDADLFTGEALPGGHTDSPTCPGCQSETDGPADQENVFTTERAHIEERNSMANRPYRVIENNKNTNLNVTVSSWHTKEDAERDASMRNIQLTEYTYRVVEVAKND